MDSFNQEVSRVVRAVLRRAMETGELAPALDLAVAAVLGPFLYRHLISRKKLARTVTGAVVDAFLEGHRTRGS